MEAKHAAVLGALALAAALGLLWVAPANEAERAVTPAEAVSPDEAARPVHRPPDEGEDGDAVDAGAADGAPVAGVARLADGVPAAGAVIEGCGGTVTADEEGRFAVAVTEPCAVRVVVRNGGAESRGPKRTLSPGSDAPIALEAPETPPWEPPVPPHWHEGGNEGLSEQQRRDERLAYLRQVLAEGSLSPEQEAMTREVVERLERQRFE